MSQVLFYFYFFKKKLDMYGTFVVTYTIWLRNEMNSLSIILKKVKKKLDSYCIFVVTYRVMVKEQTNNLKGNFIYG